jgi:peptide/nickel transport system substrate-binding protein
MYVVDKPFYIISLLLGLILILAACQAPGTPQPIVETVVVTEVVEATPVDVIQVMTPAPEPGGPRTLVICLGSDPGGLNMYGGGAISAITEAVFEGWQWGAIDTNSFTHQPILLEKLPSLADGDASVDVVTVSDGDTVMDASENVVVLDANADPPIRLFPAGGGEPVIHLGGEIEMDQVSATFKLLPGLLWSDGTPITAADSVYAFNLMADPDNNEDYFPLPRTASYEAIDDLTTVWTGLPGYLNDIYNSYFGPAPEHLWGEYSINELYENEGYTRFPVGYGPYMIDEWIEGESLTMVKNPNYFRASEGLPRFDALVFRFVGDNANDNIASLLSGECDIVDQAAGLNDEIEVLLDLQTAGQIKAAFTTGRIDQLYFGIQRLEYDDGYQLGVDRPDFFSDVRTRQAFTMCMDRQLLVDTIFFGQSLVPDSYVPPQDPLYNPDVAHYEFDVQAGSALLEEVGWVDDDGDPGTPRVAQGVANVPDGTTLEVAYETRQGNIRQQVSEMIKESLAQCGIKANAQLYPGSELFAGGPDGILFGRHFDLGQFSWGLYWCGHYMTGQSLGTLGESWVSIQDGLTRTFTMPSWEGYNVSGFANSNFDAACNSALSSLPEQARHEKAFKEAQRIFAENLPAVPLFSFIRITATRPDMCGLIVDTTSQTDFWNIEEFDYGEGCEK